MNSKKVYFVIIFVLNLIVSITSNDDDLGDLDQLSTVNELSTQTTLLKITTEVLTTDIAVSTQSEGVTTTQNSEETTTSDDILMGEEEEESPQRGLIGRFLMDGPELNQLPKNSRPEDVYKYLSGLLSDELRKEMDKVMPDMHEYFFLLQELVSQKCFIALMRFAQNAQKGETRALKLLDSSAKVIANGLSGGTYADLGDFDQCIRKDDSVLQKYDHPINGRYCLVKIRPPLPEPRPGLKYSDRILNFTNTELENKTIDNFLSTSHNLYSNPYTMGVCFVSECEQDDIRNILNNSLHKFEFGVEVGTDCYTKEVIEFSFGYFFGKLDFPSGVAVFLLGILCGVVGLATFCEFVYNLFNDENIKDSEKPFIMCFSLISNVKILYSLKANKETEGFTALNGIKVMTILWVVVSNVYYLGFQPQLKALIKNVNSEMSRRGSCLPFQLILNSWHASEIFFLIGGVLTAYSITKLFNTNKTNFNLIKYLFKRVLRLLPSMVFPILIVFMLPLMPNGGPLYKSSTGALRDTCSKNWWQSLLFINNWFEPNKTCLPHLWYVSAYIQLIIIAMAILLITYKRPILQNALVIILIIIGISFPMYLTYEKKLSAKSAFMDRPLLEEIPEILRLKHFLTFNHLSVFFIGIAIGVKLCEEKSKNSLNLLIRLLIWLVLPLISLLSVLITFLWNDVKSEPSPLLSILVNGLSRLLFISGIAWIVNECVNKRAGLVENLLSHKLLLPLSRLTYQIYLLNLPVIWFYFFTKRDLIIYRDIEILFTSCGIFVATTVLSIFGYMVFEAPFVRLSKRFFDMSSDATKRELKSQMNGKQIVIQLETIDSNGNIIAESELKCDQDYNVRL